MFQNLENILILIVASCHLLQTAAGEALLLSRKLLQETIMQHDLMLVLYYKESCKFSMNVLPIFDEVSKELQLLGHDSERVALGKVNCGMELIMCNRHNVGKYPTIRIYRYGRLVRGEYRGQRSEKAILEFINKELEDPVHEFKSMTELQQLENQKYMILGYFKDMDELDYVVFRKVALTLRDHCQFKAIFGEAARSLNPTGKNKITFYRNMAVDNVDYVSEFTGSLTSFSDLANWSQKKCSPIVRDLTFDNAEEISEEGRPLVVLFVLESDVKSPNEFEKVIEAELKDQLKDINFVTADAEVFAHPLYHLDKSVKDLPVIAIDSFEHMYIFPKYEDIHKPGKLRSFIMDLHSGELHKQYHGLETPTNELSEDRTDALEEIKKQNSRSSNKPPIKSKFKDLLPSKNRYTFLRDEL